MRTSHAVALGAAALLVAAIVAMRAGDASPDPAPSAPSAASSPGTPTSPSTSPRAPDADRVTRALRIAGVELAITADAVRVDDADGGARSVTITGTPDYAVRTPGARTEVHGDESVTVRADGGPVAALTPEAGDDPAASGDGPSPEAGRTSTLLVGSEALASATWAHREGEGGRSLGVVPAPWIRGGGDAALDLLATQLAAAVPEAGSTTMRDQLTCHHLGAPDKASWNLEPWRPDVGLLATLAARCNPTES